MGRNVFLSSVLEILIMMREKSLQLQQVADLSNVSPVAILQQIVSYHPRQVPVPMYPKTQPLCVKIF